jgi:hypothetical protein
MNNELFNILAVKNEEWVQIAIFLVIFFFAILKKVFSGLKNYVESQSRQTESGLKEYTKPVQKRHVYSQDDFKTIEQIRDEKIAKIRAAYGIPEPKKLTIPRPAYEEDQEAAAPPMPTRQARQEMPPEVIEEPIREQMFTSPPVQQEPEYIAPPVHRPKVQKKKIQSAPAMTHAQQVIQKQKEPLRQPREMLVHLTSSEDLRAAILYQEILGKPLALRE